MLLINMLVRVGGKPLTKGEEKFESDSHNVTSTGKTPKREGKKLS